MDSIRADDQVALVDVSVACSHSDSVRSTLDVHDLVTQFHSAGLNRPRREDLQQLLSIQECKRVAEPRISPISLEGGGGGREGDTAY